MTEEQLIAVLKVILQYRMVSAQYNILENNIAAFAKIVLDRFPVVIAKSYLDKIAQDEKNAQDNLEKDPGFCEVKRSVLESAKSFQGEKLEEFMRYASVILNNSARRILGYEKWPKMLIVDSKGDFISGCFLQGILFSSKSVTDKYKGILAQEVLPTEQTLCQLFWSNVLDMLKDDPELKSISLEDAPVTFDAMVEKLKRLMTNSLTVRSNLSPTIGMGSGRYVLGELSGHAVDYLSQQARETQSKELCQLGGLYLEGHDKVVLRKDSGKTLNASSEFEKIYGEQVDAVRRIYFISTLVDLYASAAAATGFRQALESRVWMYDKSRATMQSADALLPPRQSAVAAEEVFPLQWVDPSVYLDSQRLNQNIPPLGAEKSEALGVVAQSYADTVTKILRLLNLLNVMLGVEYKNSSGNAVSIATSFDVTNVSALKDQVILAMSLVQGAVDGIEAAQKTPAPSPSMRR